MIEGKGRWSNMRRVAVPGLVVALALVGCGGQSKVSGDDYTIFVQHRSLQGGGMEAIVGGTLTARDGCVLLQGREVAYPVIWPAGTSIASEDPLTLELPSGEELTMGQAVSGGGGYLPSSSDGVKVDIPAECVSDAGEVAVFNATADLSLVE